jgi:hypothetical protein
VSGKCDRCPYLYATWEWWGDEPPNRKKIFFDACHKNQDPSDCDYLKELDDEHAYE